MPCISTPTFNNLVKTKTVFPFLGIFLVGALLCLPSSLLHGQLSPDSIASVWKNPSIPNQERYKAFEQYYQSMISSSPIDVVGSSEQHWMLANASQSKKEMALAMDNKAHALCLLGEYDEAVQAIKDAYRISMELNDSLAMASKQANIGTIYYYQSKYQEAVRYFNSSLAIYQGSKEELKQADLLNNLGLVFLAIHNYPLSEEYFHKALHFYQKHEKDTLIGNIWLNLGVTYFEMGQITEAQHHADKALQIFQKTNNEIGRANCHQLFANIYELEGRVDKALEALSVSLSINEDIGNDLKILSDKTMMASLTLDKNLSEATRMGEAVLALSKFSSDLNTKTQIYKLLYKCYKKQNKHSLSLEMLEKYNLYHDSLLVEESNINVIREAIQGEFAIKLFNNQLENEKIQAELKLRQTQKTFVLILTSLILLTLLYYYYHTRRNADKKLREKLLNEIKELKNKPKDSIALQPTDILN